LFAKLIFLLNQIYYRYAKSVINRWDIDLVVW